MNNNYTDYLCHYGVEGMKWGVRRYQNSDGSYTDAGRQRYRFEYSRAKKIAKAGRYKGPIYTAARAANAYFTLDAANRVGKFVASQTKTLVSKLASSGNLQAAAFAAVGGTIVWGALMATSLINVERSIAAEVYSRSRKYKNKIDTIASEG